ncbi:uncharacterized protein CXorf38 homolog [Mya arenaria]|uniref:uncharacterized protein CXorf38 homolog n=1 Tax=Mya arenaria TaxID=6604 RepID=UPI0022E6D412|nr:uncharacterized protein CXorf38 homolog [Mya arenaria]
MAAFEYYTESFKRNENRNWLKASMGLIITKRGLAPFVERTLETFKNCQVSPGQNCYSCLTAEIVPCDPRNKVCNKRNCKFHQGVIYRRCPNKVCNRFQKVIIIEHRFADRYNTVGPSWRNTNARDWCSNAWEVAKAFMPPDGYDKITTSEDTDLNGVVSVLINCLLFEQYISDLANDENVATKVRDIGRNVRHASKLEVTDDDLKQWFDDMRALFQIPQHLAANSNAQIAVDQLNKLETDQLHIERTDVLSAIKDVVTSLEHLKCSTDADQISKLRDIQQEIAAKVEVHKRDIGDFVDEKKAELTQHVLNASLQLKKTFRSRIRRLRNFFLCSFCLIVLYILVHKKL